MGSSNRFPEVFQRSSCFVDVAFRECSAYKVIVIGEKLVVGLSPILQFPPPVRTQDGDEEFS